MRTPEYHSLAGLWEVELADGSRWEMTLPGTLDENHVGYRDAGANQWHPNDGPDGAPAFDADAPIATRLTRRWSYEGEARLTRTVDFEAGPGKRVFLEAERARCLRLLVDGTEVRDFAPPSLSTPRVFEVTGLLGRGSVLTLLSDNSYPGLPRDAIVYSSAATDETQTNWNGVLGDLRLRVEEGTFIHAARVYPRGDALDVCVAIAADVPWEGALRVESPALCGPAVTRASVPEGLAEVWLRGLPLARPVRQWDEYEGCLHALTVSAEDLAPMTVRFGVRAIGDDGAGRLTLNGRRLFLRGEANCAVFPETGHPPMTVEEWTGILRTYKSYGVNVMRFHSHCPPEAAFSAADELGMLMQPELSHWNPRDALESDEAMRCYRTELLSILDALANHPSFVMLTLGNELWAGPLGHARMDELLAAARARDDTRLYANGSNVHYGHRGCDPNSDFYTGMNYYDGMLRGISAGDAQTGGALRGHINNRYPDGMANYENVMAELRERYDRPVFGFEVGQFEVLPDFDELEAFRGVTDPANLRLVRDRVARSGLENLWKRCVEATGELSLIGYREEVEACLRTPSMSGLSLLGLQDFPGQGTALVGMLNAHLRPKPFDFARPERFHAFFRDQLPLAALEKYTYEWGETLRVPVRVANYGKRDMVGALRYALCGDGFRREGALEPARFPVGKLTDAGVIEIPLEGASAPTRLELGIRVGGVANRYPIWVYPPVSPRCPAGVLQVEKLDDDALRALDAGGRVFLSPPSTAEALPGSVPTHFTTDFWSVGTFPWQSGAMGQLIDEKHPLFARFPTEFHTNWQWWPMAGQRAVVVPARVAPIVRELDSYAALRPMAQLFECGCGSGKLMFSSMGLQDLQRYPEARALLDAIYRYMDSDDFAPEQSMSVGEIARLLA